MRILLAVGQGEARLRELSTQLEKPKTTVRSGAWRLYLNGMLRQRHDSETNEPVFALTTRGIAALKPLITTSNVRGEAR